MFLVVMRFLRVSLSCRDALWSVATARPFLRAYTKARVEPLVAEESDAGMVAKVCARQAREEFLDWQRGKRVK
jgi:hypothetical protein